MALSPDLISQFAKLTNNENKKKSETTVRGTFKTIDGEEFVQIDGSDIWTPVTSTVEAETGERVTVLIKDHTATVTGNITSPTARTKTVENLKDEVDEHGNTIKQLDNTITQQGNSIIQINNNIKQQNDTINSFGNTIDSQNNKIQSFDNTIKQQGDTITSMNNTITQQGNQITSINNTIEQHGNTINQHDNLISQQGNTITQQGNTISQQGNLISQQGNTITQQGTKLETLNSDVTILNSGFKIEDGVLTGLSEIIVNDLETNNLDAKYANIDFSNIKEAAIEKLFSDSGIIKDLIMSEGKVTGELVGVTIKGDLIEGNTVKADKLVVLGEDGLYYKLNVDALGEATASSDEKYQNGLDGSVIVAESITAEKIAVDDLVAFGATIGGYHITDHALYSGVKNSATNTTRGVFLGDDGQMAIGDANNYLRFIEEDGKYKLEIQASSLKFGTTGTTVEDAIKDVNDKSITSSVEEFYSSDSPTSVTGGEWSTTQPTWTEGKYIWRRTLITKGDGSTSYQPSENGVCITGNTGPAGATGATGATGQNGADGRGIVSTTITYQESTSGTDTPTGTWSDTIPNVNDGNYLWTKTETTYTSGDPSISYSVSRMGINGTNGQNGADGRGIVAVNITYQESTSGSDIPEGEWSNTIPTVEAGNYLWTKTETTYTSGDPSIAYSVSKSAKDGVGIKSMVTMYQTSSDGVNPPTGDWHLEVQETTREKPYLWSRTTIAYTDGTFGGGYSVGAALEGVGIETVEIAYQISSDGTNTPDGEWSDIIIETTYEKPYLWTRTITTYTDGTESIAYSVGGTLLNDTDKGRNLILNSDTEYTSSEKLIARYIPSMYLEEGETYTATICVDPNEEQTDSDMYSKFELSLSNDHKLQCSMNSNEREKYTITKTFTASYAPGMTPDVNHEYGVLQLDQTISKKEYLNAPSEIYVDANNEYMLSVDLEPGTYMIRHSGMNEKYDSMGNGDVLMTFVDNNVEESYIPSGLWVPLEQRETTIKFTFNTDNYNDVTSGTIKNIELYKVIDNTNYLEPFLPENIALDFENNEVIIPVDIEPGLYILYDKSYDYFISVGYELLDNDEVAEYLPTNQITNVFGKRTGLKITLSENETNFTSDNPLLITDLVLNKLIDDGVNYLDDYPDHYEIDKAGGGGQHIPAGFYKFTCSGIDIHDDDPNDIDSLKIEFQFHEWVTVKVNKYNFDGFTCYFEIPFDSHGLTISTGLNTDTWEYGPLKCTVHNMTLTRTTDINRVLVMDHITIPPNDKFHADSYAGPKGTTLYLSWDNMGMPDDGSIEIVAYRMEDSIANRITIDKTIADAKGCELLLKNEYMYYYEIINNSNEAITIENLKIRYLGDSEVSKPDEGLASKPMFNNTIRWIKVEKGDEATDWSPAPEDIYNKMVTEEDLTEVEETLNNRINDAQSTITMLEGMIANLVTDANGGSLMTQTPDGWTFNMSNITGNLEAIQNAMEDSNTRQQETNNELQKLTDLVSDVVARTAYVTIATDDNGDPCIELGRSDNLFKVRITNTAIDFLEGSAKIAYANNNTFYSSKLITKAIQIGEGPGFVWQTRASGNMGLIYISN